MPKRLPAKVYFWPLDAEGWDNPISFAFF
jgi:hypothetical protein